MERPVARGVVKVHLPLVEMNSFKDANTVYTRF